jgi:hypothetical protein
LGVRLLKTDVGTCQREVRMAMPLAWLRHARTTVSWGCKVNGFRGWSLRIAVRILALVPVDGGDGWGKCPSSVEVVIVARLYSNFTTERCALRMASVGHGAGASGVRLLKT